MNEEIKIIIRAVADPAKKAIAEVNQELDKVKGSSKEAGVSVDAAMKGIGKGVAIAVAAITGLTAAMANLGKSAQEVQKGFNKLNTSFLTVGSTTDQAAKSYKELYGFLGDHDKAIETAQSLALITQNEQDLAEWTNILQGAFGLMGDKLPIEGLAEAANETIKVGQVTGVMADALNWVGVSEDQFNASLEKTTSLSEREALVRSTLTTLYGNAAQTYGAVNQATIAYNQSQANLNLTLSQASAYTTPLLTSLNNLGSTLLTVFGPALQTISVYLTGFIQLISEAVLWVGNFFGLFSSKTSETTSNMSGYQEAVKNYQSQLQNYFGKTAGAVDGTINKVKELKKQTMGFDELNIVSNPVTSTPSGGGTAAGGGAGAMPQMPNPADFGLGGDALGFEEVKKDIEEAKEKIKSILPLVGIVAATLAGWKVVNFINDLRNASKLTKAVGDFVEKHGSAKFFDVFGKKSDEVLDKATEKYNTMISKINSFVGVLAIVAGAILTIKGYSDAWINGLDWANFGEILGGIALVIAGLAIAFGPVAAGVGAVAGGIAMLVIGIKDMIENGANLKNILMVVVGAITAVTGALVAMGKANIKAIAGWIKHTAAIVAHKVAQIASKVATVALTVAQTALNLVMNMSPLGWIVTAIAAVVAAFVILWNKCDGFRQFWYDLWEGIKAGFQAVVDWFVSVIDWLKNLFTKIGNFIKENWQALLLFLVNPLAGIFKILYDNCDGFREFIDNTVQKIKDFFVNLWKAISEGAVKAWNAVVNAFKVAGTWMYEKVIKPVGDFFVNMWSGLTSGAVKAWEGVKTAFSKVGSFFKDTFSKAWQGVKNVFSTGGKIFDGIKDGIVSAFKTVVNAIIKGINKVVALPFKGLNGILDTLSAIEIAGIEPFSWLTWRAPIPEIPLLAKGGIVDSATLAMIGERGKEAVIPLENNTGWMDTLADRLAERQAAPSKIVLMLDGKELGYATVNSINNLTKQTGRLPLVLA